MGHNCNVLELKSTGLSRNKPYDIARRPIFFQYTYSLNNHIYIYFCIIDLLWRGHALSHLHVAVNISSLPQTMCQWNQYQWPEWVTYHWRPAHKVKWYKYYHLTYCSYESISTIITINWHIETAMNAIEVNKTLKWVLRERLYRVLICYYLVTLNALLTHNAHVK